MEGSGNDTIGVDIGNVFNKMLSLFRTSTPSDESIISSTNMAHAPLSVDAGPTSSIKLDNDVTTFLADDIARLGECSSTMSCILERFTNFADRSDSTSTYAEPQNSGALHGEAAALSATSGILDPITTIDLFSRLCSDNTIAVENLSQFIIHNNQFWTLFPSAIITTYDVLCQVLILWYKIGARIDLASLATKGSNCESSVVDHTNPRVIIAQQKSNQY